jgi:hypothetical protein
MKLTKEEIDSMGQESEIKAAKWVKEKGKEKDKEVEKEESKKLETLEQKTKRVFLDYKQTLADILDKEAFVEEFPKEWKYHVAVTEKGICMFVVSPEKKLYVRAISPVNEPKYDLTAVYSILESVWVLIEKYNSTRGILNGRARKQV